jgi:hypothetical protein
MRKVIGFVRYGGEYLVDSRWNEGTLEKRLFRVDCGDRNFVSSFVSEMDEQYGIIVGYEKLLGTEEFEDDEYQVVLARYLGSKAGLGSESDLVSVFELKDLPFDELSMLVINKYQEVIPKGIKIVPVVDTD